MLRMTRLSMAVITLAVTLFGDSVASESTSARIVPSRRLPVPDSVTPRLREILSEAPQPSLKIPSTTEEWRALATPDSGSDKLLIELQKQFDVQVSSETLGGVACFLVTPNTVKEINSHRLLIGFHSGGFVFSSGKSGLAESIVTAHYTGTKVVSVDYRMLPDYPFPAAMDDAMAVWKQAIRMYAPPNIAIFGSSVGGNMVLSLVQRARREGLPLPGAVISATPWSDLSKTGDSYYANDGVDSAISYDGFWAAVARVYARGRDLKDPLLSPVYGEFSGFPPTFLITGTRDLFLSNTVRVQQKLLDAGVYTQLEVEEGQSHMEYLGAVLAGAREGVRLYVHISQFVDTHLRR